MTEAQVDRMLRDPRAIDRSVQFIEQWLDLGRLENLAPSPNKFPAWNDLLGVLRLIRRIGVTPVHGIGPLFIFTNAFEMFCDARLRCRAQRGIGTGVKFILIDY